MLRPHQNRKSTISCQPARLPGSRNKDLDWENVHGMNMHIILDIQFIYIYTYTYLFTWYRDINLLQHIQNAVCICIIYKFVSIINLYILQYINLIYSELDIGIFGMQKTWRHLRTKHVNKTDNVDCETTGQKRYVTEGLLTMCCHYEGGIVLGHTVIAVETRRFWLWV